MKGDSIIGSWNDPLGRRIILTLDQWVGHIIRRHPDMTLRLEAVGEVLSNPEIILRDGDELLYFRLLHRNDFKVVVRFGKIVPHEGFVVTAYRVRTRSQKGVLEWPKN